MNDEFEIRVPIDLPADHDGFIRRECPHCMAEFKWHNGSANEAAESKAIVDTYYCPLCGQPAGMDSWWTQLQLAYLEQAAEPIINEVVDDQIDKMFREVKSKGLSIKRTGRTSIGDAPNPLTEPDDMEIVASPCHGWEPVKVPEGAPSPLYCLVCGAGFAV